jgi:ADP-ribose pyrophosphatase
MKKLIKVEKQTNNKFLNMYLAYFENSNPYQFASRSKNIDELDINNESIETDAIRVLPYYIKDREIYIILIKEFRYPVNKYIYSIPAGLVEKGEPEESAVKRELLEETGYKALNITHVHKASYISAGMCDETISTYVALVDYTNKKPQSLDEDEEIEVFSIKLDDVLLFFEENDNVGYQTRLFVENFYYKTKLENK